MAANPITLVVLAIGALVAAFVLAYQKSETFRDAVNGLFGAIKTGVVASVEFIKGYLETVMGFYKSIFNGIATLWNNTIGKLSFTVPSWVPGFGGKGFSVPKIPMLAEGGIVTGPTLAMIGEKGPEAVVPLNRGNIGGNITVNVYSTLADATLPDKLVNALRQYNRRSGVIDIRVA
jgi:phage-related minor tail protein